MTTTWLFSSTTSGPAEREAAAAVNGGKGDKKRMVPASRY
jgi:hypothetical protein